MLLFPSFVKFVVLSSSLVNISNCLLSTSPKLLKSNYGINRQSSLVVALSSPRNIEVGESRSYISSDILLNHGLLTAAHEFGLARQFKVSVQIQAQRKMMDDSYGRPVTDEELANVLETPIDRVGVLLSKGNLAKKILVKANMRLVFHIAKCYRFRGVSYPDLVQEGTFGLIKAIEKYNPDRGFRFSTYASWWIKQAMSRSIAEKSRIVRLPVHIHDMMLSVDRTEKELTVLNSRRPTPEELAERLALPISKVELLLSCSRTVNSIDQNVYQNKGQQSNSNEVQVKDRLVSASTHSPSAFNDKRSMRQDLRNAMEILSEREAQIVEMRFGLGDGNPMTLEEIGKQFNVTRERIRQIEARALAKMRHNNGDAYISDELINI